MRQVQRRGGAAVHPGGGRRQRRHTGQGQGVDLRVLGVREVREGVLGRSKVAPRHVIHQRRDRADGDPGERRDGANAKREPAGAGRSRRGGGAGR